MSSSTRGRGARTAKRDRGDWRAERLPQCPKMARTCPTGSPPTTASKAPPDVRSVAGWARQTQADRHDQALAQDAVGRRPQAASSCRMIDSIMIKPLIRAHRWRRLAILEEGGAGRCRATKNRAERETDGNCSGRDAAPCPACGTVSRFRCREEDVRGKTCRRQRTCFEGGRWAGQSENFRD